MLVCLGRAVTVSARAARNPSFDQRPCGIPRTGSFLHRLNSNLVFPHNVLSIGGGICKVFARPPPLFLRVPRCAMPHSPTGAAHAYHNRHRIRRLPVCTRHPRGLRRRSACRKSLGASATAGDSYSGTRGRRGRQPVRARGQMHRTVRVYLRARSATQRNRPSVRRQANAGFEQSFPSTLLAPNRGCLAIAGPLGAC